MVKKYKLSQKARNYRPRSISDKYCNDILLEMILNNMKIEDQEVSKEEYLKFRDTMQRDILNKKADR